MNLNHSEGYRRLSLAASIGAGPAWFLYQFISRGWKLPQYDEVFFVILAVVAISGATWLTFSLFKWIATGFTTKAE